MSAIPIRNSRRYQFDAFPPATDADAEARHQFVPYVELSRGG
jgi:hypothetical protein